MQKLINIVETFFNINIDENSKLGSVEKWDSLGHLNLFMKLEEEYGINFNTDEILNSISIKDIYTLIKSKQ